MSMTAGEFGSLRFSSDRLRPVDRVPFYRDVVGRTLTRMNIEPLDENFSCNAHICGLHDLRIMSIAGSAVRVSRTPAMAEGDDKLALLILLEGAATVSQRGREASAVRGSSILFSGTDPFRIDRTTAHFVSVGVPMARLAPLLSSPDAALMSVMPCRLETLRLLAGYVDLLLNSHGPMETAELRRLAINHLLDLFVLALGATPDAARIAAGRGLRAARLRAIKADIAQNLEGDVTAAALSMRHRISPRYIRKLFEGEGTSLSHFVLGQRLTRVHRMLTDPRYAGRSIADIALAAGFGDLSTFNRAFRRRFGMTPSDVRHGRQ